MSQGKGHCSRNYDHKYRLKPPFSNHWELFIRFSVHISACFFFFSFFISSDVFPLKLCDRSWPASHRSAGIFIFLSCQCVFQFSKMEWYTFLKGKTFWHLAPLQHPLLLGVCHGQMSVYRDYVDYIRINGFPRKRADTESVQEVNKMNKGLQ